VSEAREAPRRIVVAGVGQLGLLAAIALRRALPTSEVLVIASPPDPGALCDRLGIALPFSNRLHDRLGISEEALVTRCGGSHRLAMHCIGWGGEGQQGFAAYGALIDPKMKTAFAREWGGGPRNAQTNMPVLSIGEALARAGRFAPPPPGSGSPLGEVDYALRWNVPAYRDLLIGMAEQLGVSHVAGQPRELVIEPDGLVSAVLVDGVGEISADFYVDCSGPWASLLSPMPGFTRIDWDDPAGGRRLLISKAGEPIVALEDRATLSPLGWLQEYAGRDGRLAILGMADGASQDAAAALLGSPPDALLRMPQGRAERSWLGNVVALGDAAAHFEPLGWLNLDLAHRQLDLLLELLPGSPPDARERDEFNRRAALMADRAHDVIALHYCAPAARAVFGEVPLSPEMEMALDQFTRRGRLPFFEEMPLLVQEWGHLLDALGIAAGEGAMQRAGGGDAKAAAMELERKCEAALRAAPPYRDWMVQVLERAQR
jgi:tryptophan halogenase